MQARRECTETFEVLRGNTIGKSVSELRDLGQRDEEKGLGPVK